MKYSTVCFVIGVTMYSHVRLREYPVFFGALEPEQQVTLAREGALRRELASPTVALVEMSDAPKKTHVIVGPKNDSCDLRLMCQWRYVLAASRGTSVTPGKGQPGASGTRASQRSWSGGPGSRGVRGVHRWSSGRAASCPSSCPTTL